MNGRIKSLIAFAVLASAIAVSYASDVPSGIAQQAADRVSSVRNDLRSMLFQLPSDTPDSVRSTLDQVDQNLSDTRDMIMSAINAPQVQAKPWVCVIVDGKGHVLPGEGNTRDEAYGNAKSQCNLCGMYPTINETCSQRSSQIRCEVRDGKGHVYYGTGPTEADALMQPYRQCGVICTMYPHTHSCAQM